jgi:hypothetical protein
MELKFSERKLGELRERKSLAFWLAVSFLGVAAVLLFARLGHYPLWEDEAMAALGAKGVVRHLDTSALPDDHNICAYDKGSGVRNLNIREISPLQFYLAAPFLAAFGMQSALAARLPFALCGLGTFVLIYWWLWRGHAGVLFALLVCLGLACNVSLLLYSRQCRYYSPGILGSVAVAYLYLNWKGQTSRLLAMTAVSTCLLAVNYLYYGALYVCLAADYSLWKRKENRLRARDWLLLLLPQMVVGALVIWIWNPSNNKVAHQPPWPDGWLAGKCTLFWFALRDLDRCEFGVPLLLLATPLLYWKTRNPWLVRAPAAFFIFVLAATICSADPYRGQALFNVRYLTPVIPLCVAIESLALCALTRGRTWLAVTLGSVLFGTNLFNGGPLLWCGFRSTIASYLGETVHPHGDPFSETARWINEHVRAGESIAVIPDTSTYPLMFHAPKATYAWQLSGPPEGQFAGLPLIHFFGAAPPDYFIVFGLHGNGLDDILNSMNVRGARYECIVTNNNFWFPLYRPELFWRTFEDPPLSTEHRKALGILGPGGFFYRATPVSPWDGNAIYIFKKAAAGNSET